MLISKSAIPLILLTLCLFTANISAQITYTKHFTETLQAAHLDFYKPLEQWFHVTPKKKDKLLKYDLVILNDDENMEMRFILKPYEADEFDQFPQVDNMRIIHHIATNDPEADIVTMIIDEKQAKQRYNADWVSVHYFSPKLSLSSKPHAAMITLFATGKATANVILLYDDPSFDVLTGFHQLKFRD